MRSTATAKCRAASLLALLALLAGCDLGARPDEFAHLPDHERMVATMKARAAETREENRWSGDARLREERALLDRLEKEPASLELLRLSRVLAIDELRVGNARRAIELVERAYALIAVLGDEVSNDEAIETAFQVGVCYMRLGEIVNCSEHNSAEACILPFRGHALHMDTAGSRAATRYFTEVLERSGGEHLIAKWLLNITYMTLDEHPEGVPEEYLIPPSTFESPGEFPAFANVAGQLGLDTVTEAGPAVVEDFDNDGLLDVVTGSWRQGGELLMFRNEGDGTFSDRSEAAFRGIPAGLNVVQADFDNDGLIDILVLRGAWMGSLGFVPNSLLRNQGDGTFTDVTFSSGLGDRHYPTQTAAWADYDNDGDLDLYIGNESRNRWRRAPGQLFSNQGDGTFVDLAKQAGVENFGYAKGVSWGDYDEDGWIDLYVSNRTKANRLYHNNADGTFSDRAVESGVDAPRDSFSTWFWDYNNDGHLDIYVTSRISRRKGIEHWVRSLLGESFESDLSRLYRGDGRGGFEDVTVASGLTRLGFPMGANFGDITDDGYPEIYLGTGFRAYEGLVPSLL